MEFVALNKEKLNLFINSKEFESLPNIPISGHRAYSQINNPRAETNDILLLLTYIDNNLCGYLGALPDYIYIDSIERIKCAWLSCIWVHNNYRGEGIANKMLSEMYSLWDGKLLMTNFTDAAKKLYDKSGYFSTPIDYLGIKAYMRLNLRQLIPQKNPKRQNIKWFLSLIDFSFNLINTIKLVFTKKLGNIDDLIIEYVEKFNVNDENLIRDLNEENAIKRNVSELNWIINYPWLKSGNPKSAEAKKYAFSSLSKQFNMLNIRIKNKHNEILGYLILHIRDKQMKVPYAFIIDENAITRVIFYIMFNNKIRNVLVFNKQIVNYLNNCSTPFFKIRQIKRQYLFTKKIAEKFESIENMSFQDGDGDSAFT